MSEDRNPQQRQQSKATEHRHMLVTVYRRRWQDLFRASHEIRCWTCPVVVREPRP